MAPYSSPGVIQVWFEKTFFTHFFKLKTSEVCTHLKWTYEPQNLVMLRLLETWIAPDELYRVIFILLFWFVSSPFLIQHIGKPS